MKRLKYLYSIIFTLFKREGHGGRADFDEIFLSKYVGD